LRANHQLSAGVTSDEERGVVNKLGHPDVEDLLGAYALDALDPDERDAVDLHLRECPRCRAEVADFRETASLLAYGGAEAPPGVWEKIQASLEEAPPRLELARVVPIDQARAKRWQRLLVANAAVVLLIAALAVVALRRDPSPSDDGLRGDFAAAIGHPDAKNVHLAAAGGEGSVDLVLLDGQAYLYRNSLPALREDETYQLWGQQGETKVSLGVLGAKPGQLVVAADASYEALAITAEKKPGVVSSSNPAVVAGLVPD
jgi:anti-sigma-K factor RskA